MEVCNLLLILEKLNSAGVRTGYIANALKRAKGGLRRGDVIVEWDGTPVQNVGMFRPMIALTELGSVVTVKIIRDGKPKWLSVHLTLPRTSS